MKITREAEYGIRLIRYLSKRPGEAVSSAAAADDCDIPKMFLPKVAQGLKKHGLLDIRKGSTGGLVLENDKPVDLLQVVEAIMGPVNPFPTGGNGPFAIMYSEINGFIRQLLSEYELNVGDDI